MKGCMNCGNISCGNNKKRDCAGCGRWISPEDKIAELEEKVGMAERTRDRLKAMGFPTLASCKEYSAKLETLEKENERLTVDYETLKLHDEEEIAQLRAECGRNSKTALLNLDGWRKSEANIRKAKEIIKNLLILHNDTFGNMDLNWRCMVVAEAEKFPMECPDVE